uniref:ATP synthase subunit delta, chloroplastic n=1 Tax=Polysiphonia scopulorum TaxID=257860 RepID=A0A1Z1MIK9_9FLOR|nr:ATP synthase CF1 subunit delta [Polysiphonia scopulorum]ARW65581.1 ATP synthase CF1 subunit delta [Polysiphonia scopulorum]
MINQSFKEKIATPYAEALIDYAKNKDFLSQATNELSSISTVLSESSELQLLLLNPLVASSVKKEVIQKLFKNQVQDFILNFLLVLVDRRRISFLSTIIEKYLDLVNLLESVTIAEVYSAVDLSELQQKNLIDKIKLITNSKTVKLVVNKDPNLIGGFVIKVGSKVIDASLSGKLKQMSLYLNTN